MRRASRTLDAPPMTRVVRRGVEKGAVYPYEEARSLLNPLRRIIQHPALIAGRLPLSPDARVLELGPGPGYFSVDLARRVPFGSLHLVDLQAPMLAMARERLRAARATNVRYATGDALALPYPAEVFDVAVLVTVLGEVPDPAACVRELKRVLRPSGTLSVSELIGDADFIGRNDLRRMAVNEGFALVGSFGFKWNYTLNFRPREE